MNCVFITMKGSFRSWGTTSVGDDRETDLFPTASAVLGLAGACMGVDLHSKEQVKSWYSGFHVVTLSAVSYLRTKPNERHPIYNPSLLVDFHTISDSLTMGGTTKNDSVLSYRNYITDALDVAVIIARHEDANNWLGQLAMALHQPRFTPYLGRRCNPLSTPLAEPNETMIWIDSIEEVTDRMFLRLTKLSIADLKPYQCCLRVSNDLESNSNRLKEKWSYKKTEFVADQRTGAFRTFENRKIHLYTRYISQRGDSDV